MRNDNLEDLFQSLDFDIAEPAINHQKRFKEKLDSGSSRNVKSSGVISLFLPWLSVAACFFIGIFLFQGSFTKNEGELASISTEMAETQNFYASVISKELYRLEQEKTPETEAVIQDALKQLNILEKDYKRLKTDLVESQQDNRVIHAMINNFQQRIDLLNHVLQKVNQINIQKITPHENNLL